MHKHFLSIVRIVCIFGGLLAAGFIHEIAAAEPVPSVVISRVAVREAPVDDSTNSSNEFVEIANNNSSQIDITNWCLRYASVSSPETFKTLGCFLPHGDNGHVILPPLGRALAATAEYLNAHNQTAGYDFIFKPSLSNDAGYLRLVDSNSQTVDTINWGVGVTSVNAGASVGSQVMDRINLSDGQLQQTGKPADDFKLVAPALNYASTAQYVLDLCLNLDNIQTEVPPGLSLDGEGNCSPPSVDVCLNIDGVQSALPQGDTADEAGNCYPASDNSDVVAPLDDSQNTNSAVEAQPIMNLELSEVLANPVGADTGREFIELYNPNATPVSVNDYQLFVDDNLVDKLSGQTIEPTSYLVLTNDTYDFRLLNTSGQLSLLLAGKLVDSTTYDSPKDGWSWSKIAGVWQYTNQVTPAAANLALLLPANNDAVVIAPTPACPAGQERNPDTNRCRKLVVADTNLACPAGQYRNPTTNRCRSIAATASVLASCGPDEERNPLTNRCHKVVLASSESTACPAGQERNPATNRCRKLQVMPTADYAVAGVKTEQAAGSKLIWWLVGGVLLLCLIYALYEWRHEIVKLWQRWWPWQRPVK